MMKLFKPYLKSLFLMISVLWGPFLLSDSPLPSFHYLYPFSDIHSDNHWLGHWRKKKKKENTFKKKKEIAI